MASMNVSRYTPIFGYVPQLFVMVHKYRFMFEHSKGKDKHSQNDRYPTYGNVNKKLIKTAK